MTCQYVAMLFLCLCTLVCEVSAMCKMYEDLGVPMVSKILDCDYYKEYRPVRNKSEIVKVEFTMYIQDINSINAEDMDFRIDLFLHMTWSDHRLNLTNIIFNEADPSGMASGSDYITLPAYLVDHIWMPDPYITNSKDAAITKLTTTYASFTLYRNSTIRYSARVYSIIACQMEFHEYPMDVQNCSLNLQSFMYTIEEVQFLWRPWSPIMINPDLKLNQFSMKKPLQATSKIINDSIDIIGVGGSGVQILVVVLQFSREIGHHLVQTFVPSFLVVALSWFSFWMGLEAIPGRVTLLVTSLLTLTTLFTGIKDDLPPVAYVKAIDVWMAGCMVFVFSALGEFVVVRVIKNSNENDSEAMKVRGTNQVFPDFNFNQSGSQRPYSQAKRSDYLRMLKQALNNSNNNHNDSDLATDAQKTMKIMENGSQNGISNLINAWDAEGGEGNVVLRHPNSRRPSIGRLNLHWIDEKTGKNKVLWMEIDKASRIVFPIMFLLFMIIYFPILISRSF